MMHRRVQPYHTAATRAVVRAFLFVGLIAGCRKHVDAPTAATAPPRRAEPPATASLASGSSVAAKPSSAPTTAPAVAAAGNTAFESKSGGFRTSYPATWSPQPRKDFVLELVPGASDEKKSPATVSVDVPDLPPHLPGMIRMSLIESHFVDHLKQRFGDVKVEDRKDATLVPQAQERLLTLTWRASDGQQYKQEALLMIHSSRVYIIRGTAPAEDFARADAAFQEVAHSWQWSK
jgi:hypothetical protein